MTTVAISIFYCLLLGFKHQRKETYYLQVRGLYANNRTEERQNKQYVSPKQQG